MIPLLGTDKTTIYKEWERVDREISGGSMLVVGWVVGYALFGWLHGQVCKLYTGRIPTYEFATKDDLDEIDRAIDNGTFQVECRYNWRTGNLPSYVYHQATGKRLDTP